MKKTPTLLDLYEAIKPYTIYCDMDGVLCDFDKGYKKLTGISTQKANAIGKPYFWKLFREKLKEKNIKEMGASELNGKKMVEDEIVDKYITVALCEKIKAKIELEKGWSSKFIPQLLNTVYYDLITEESWNFVKEFNNPTINFNTLKHFVFMRVKSNLPSIF